VSVMKLIVALLRVLLASRAALVAENLALRQQRAVVQRSVNRPRMRRCDRVFWVGLSRLWRGRKSPRSSSRHNHHGRILSLNG